MMTMMKRFFVPVFLLLSFLLTTTLSAHDGLDSVDSSFKLQQRRVQPALVVEDSSLRVTTEKGSVKMGSDDAERYFELMDVLLSIDSSASFSTTDLRVLREILSQNTKGSKGRLHLRKVQRIPLERCLREQSRNEGEVCLALLLDSRSHGTQHYHLWYQPSSASPSSLTTSKKVLFDIAFELIGPLSECSLCQRAMATRREEVLPKPETTTSVNNGSDSINELIDLSRQAECERDDFTGECKQGTVLPASAWLNWTLSDQRNRSLNIPIPFLTIVNTHNSYNNKADGYGDGDFTIAKLLELVSEGKWDFVWAQQYFTMTDQLNLGARSMMLDPVWFDEEIRLCHCGTSFPWFDKVLQFLEKELHKNFTFDSNDLGCTPFDRPYSEGVEEIAEWMALHPSEVILLEINDEGYSADWGHQALIQNQTWEALGPILFTPVSQSQHFPGGQWPTISEMVSLGQRVLAHGSRVYDSYIFPELLIPGWDLDTMKYFARDPYPNCMGYQPGQWTSFGGESQVIGPIYNGPQEEGLVTLENMGALLDCGVSEIGMDLASPLLFNAYVWSWLPDQPELGFCTAISANSSDSTTFGRWATFACSSQLPVACAQPSGNSSTPFLLMEWTIGSSASWFSASTVCEDLGLEFAIPSDPYSNRKLKDAILASPVLSEEASSSAWVWLNLMPLQAPPSSSQP